MASSPSLERMRQELERITSSERLEARGTLRLVLEKAGLDAGLLSDAEPSLESPEAVFQRLGGS